MAANPGFIPVSKGASEDGTMSGPTTSLENTVTLIKIGHGITLVGIRLKVRKWMKPSVRPFPDIT